jgi:hypothetical protein
MSKYRKVDPKIWNDFKFMELSRDGKLVFFFILTHPSMTALGAMRASVPGLAAEIVWPDKDFKKAFNEVLSRDMVRHDARSSFLWLPKFLKYNKPESPNVVKAWKNSLDLLPECNMKSQLIQSVKDFAEALPEVFLFALPEAFLEDLSKSMSKSMPYQEQEQEQEIYIEHLDFVKLTENQHKKLIERFGEDGTKERIEKLNIYIGKKGAKKFYLKYSSCYHCILDWYGEKQSKTSENSETRETSFDAAGRELKYV